MVAIALITAATTVALTALLILFAEPIWLFAMSLRDELTSFVPDGEDIAGIAAWCILATTPAVLVALAAFGYLNYRWVQRQLTNLHVIEDSDAE